MKMQKGDFQYGIEPVAGYGVKTGRAVPGSQWLNANQAVTLLSPLSFPSFNDNWLTEIVQDLLVS
jgi:hypothetical protein